MDLYRRDEMMDMSMDTLDDSTSSNNLMFFGGAPPKPAGPAGGRAKSAATAKPAPRSASPAVTAKATTPMDIVLQASASGSFALDASFATLLGTSLAHLTDKCPEALKSFLDVWATALAIAALELRFADSHDEWSLVHTKARRFITKTVSSNGIDITFDKILAEAKAAL